MFVDHIKTKEDDVKMFTIPKKISIPLIKVSHLLIQVASTATFARKKS